MDNDRECCCCCKCEEDSQLECQLPNMQFASSSDEPESFAKIEMKYDNKRLGCNDNQRLSFSNCLTPSNDRYCASQKRLFFVRSHWLVFGRCCFHIKLNSTFEPRVIDLLCEFSKTSKIPVGNLELFYNERRLDTNRNVSLAKLGIPDGARLCVHCAANDCS